MAYNDLMSGEWQFINTITPPPSTGQVRLDAANQTLAKRLWVHTMMPTSVDARNYLSSFKVGNEIALQDKDDSTKWQVFSVTGLPIDRGSYFEYPVKWLRGGGAVPEQRILLVVSAGTSGTTAGDYRSPFAHPSNSPAGLFLGLTTRQYYAGQALVGFISNSVAANLIGNLSSYAFKVADSMIQYERDEAAGLVPPLAGEPSRAPRPQGNPNVAPDVTLRRAK